MIINAKMDDVWKMIMEELEIEIPAFKLNRWVKLTLKKSEEGTESLQVRGIDETGCPYDLFRGVKINGEKGHTQDVSEEQMNDPETVFIVKLWF